MAFKIYYDDGTTQSSWEQPPEGHTTSYESGEVAQSSRGFPPRGIVAIIQDDKEYGWTILAGFDYYVWWRGAWAGANLHQLLDMLIDMDVLVLNKDGIKVMRRGGWKKVNDIQLKVWLDESGKVLTGRHITGSQLENILSRATFDAEFPEKTKWFINEPKLVLRAPGVINAFEENR